MFKEDEDAFVPLLLLCVMRSRKREKDQGPSIFPGTCASDCVLIACDSFASGLMSDSFLVSESVCFVVCDGVDEQDIRHPDSVDEQDTRLSDSIDEQDTRLHDSVDEQDIHSTPLTRRKLDSLTLNFLQTCPICRKVVEKVQPVYHT